MEFLKRNNFFIIFILFCFSFYILGIKWGLPSKKLNSLYFYKNENLYKTIEIIKNYKEEIWKGYGWYLILHPEEEEKKLPRNLYNSIRSYHPDEYFIIKVLASMKPEKFDFNPHQFAIGGVYLYFVGFVIFILSKLKILFLTKEIDFYFKNPDQLSKFYITGRLITVFYATGMIILSYSIAKKLYKNSKNALLVTFLISFSPLIILNCSYMYVDIPGLFWIMACLYYSIKNFENPSFKNFFITGFFSGLATGTKIPLFISIFIPLISSILTFKEIKKLLISFIYILGGAIISFGITNPYFFITFPMPLFELRQHTPISFSGKFYIKSLGYGIGWPIFITGIIGLILNKKNYNKKIYILFLLWISLYFLFISLFSKNYGRYILPIVPPFIITGYGFWIEKNIKKPFNYFKIFVLYISVLFSFIYGLSFKSLFLKLNTRTEAGIWIKENIPKDKTIGVCEVPWQFQMPPFDYFYYKVFVLNYDFEKLKKESPEYFIISSFQSPIPPYPLNLQKERIQFYEKFIKSNLYILIKTFQRFPSFSIIKFKFKILPEDLIYINPTILIFKKNEGNI
ncbi:MAG: ArnT family glycosyltransferase [Candidatus Ratteibacteria bacterium]